MKFNDTLSGLINRFPYLISSSVYSALLVSHGIRSDVKLVLHFNDPLCITFNSDRLRNLRPDMQSTIGFFRKVLSMNLKYGRSGAESTLTTGVSYSRIDFPSLIKGSSNLFFNDDKGMWIDEVHFPKNFKFIIFYPFADPSILQLLVKLSAKPIKVASKYKLPGALLTILSNYLDKQEVKRND
ncbi:MAG: hypothetical protein HA488_01470 [Candidatus Verstraetearchaeota archaeon]|nr:hypothetical protein [Candidatus Verstraetearchaeota archaeon]